MSTHLSKVISRNMREPWEENDRHRHWKVLFRTGCWKTNFPLHLISLAVKFCENKHVWKLCNLSLSLSLSHFCNPLKNFSYFACSHEFSLVVVCERKIFVSINGNFLSIFARFSSIFSPLSHRGEKKWFLWGKK